MRAKVVEILATFFYVGKVPWAPGTAGSLAGLFLFLAFARTPASAFMLFMILAAAGFLVSGKAEKAFGKKDPPEVVIDEVAGMILVFFAVPLSPPVMILGFLLYRVLDIVKPFPARRLEALSGSRGIMADDIVCGIYARLLLLFVCRAGFLC